MPLACVAGDSLSTLPSPRSLLKSKSSSAWSAAKSEEHYGFKRWGSGHISVDTDGFVNVQPLVDGRGIRVLDVVQEALGMGLKAPMVIRFQDLLRHRVTQLNEMFAKAIKEDGWNEYHLIARGHTIAHILNGKVMSVIIDDDAKNRRADGLIGVQVHVGPPMKVEYRNIRLKTLK